MKRSQIIPCRFITLPVITNTSLPNATTGVPYSAQLTGTGGDYPYTWTSTPLGVFSLNASSGVISGTPITGGLFTATFTITDSCLPPNSTSTTLSIFVQTAVVITTTSPLPGATVGIAYSTTLAATGGTPPYTWSILSDTPDTGSWLSINASTGVLSGTPGTAETESLSIKALDSLGIPSAPTSFSLSVSTVSSYVFDHFISPTGSDANPGTLGSPWSSSAIQTKAGSYTQLGALPGTYTRSTSTDAAGGFWAYINANGSLAGHTIPAGASGTPIVVASCNASGAYSPRTAIFDCGNAGTPSVRNGAVFTSAGDWFIVDGLVIQNFSSGAMAFGGSSHAQVLNCDLKNQVAPSEQNNSSALSFNGQSPPNSANDILIYNTYIHNCQILPPQSISFVPGTLTATGATMTATAPWDTGGNYSIKLSTGQVIGPGVTSTFGSATLSWANTTITGSPTNTAEINLTSYSGGTQLDAPFGAWGFYCEAGGSSAPIRLVNCHMQKIGWNGCKTARGTIQLSRCYLEQTNFAVSQNGTFWAVTGLNCPAGNTSSMDHCIAVGNVFAFNAGSVSNVQAHAGTLNFFNNTLYTNAPITPIRPSFCVAMDQSNPGTLTAYNNLVATSASYTLFAVGGGSSFGTVTQDHNVYNGPTFRHTNTGVPNNPTGTTYDLPTWQTTFGLDSGSIDLAGASPFINTPVQGDTSTFAVTGATLTAGRSGATAGAMDGTLGANGVSVGVNFWYPGAWQTLKVGGGGYVRGLIMHADGTMVGRTDTAGAYLWNAATSTWNQLVNPTSMPASYIATDPVEIGGGVFEVAIYAGNSQIMYMNFNNLIWKTTNQGKTWTQTGLPAKTSTANTTNSQWGQKLAIDPQNSNIVYAAVDDGSLWVTVNGGSTWTQVSTASIPLSAAPGITGILFSPTSSVVGGVTQTIYACSNTHGVYVTTNGGTTWTLTSGGPTTVQNAQFDSAGNYWCSGNATSVFKYNGTTWANLFTGGGNGTQAVAVNPFNQSEITAIDQAGRISHSADAGATWTGTNNSGHIAAAQIPWEVQANTNGGNLYYLSAGNAAFSPLTNGRMYLSAGTGAWYMDVPPAMTNVSAVVWNDMSMGIENLIAIDIIVPPGGVPTTANWDRGVFFITPGTYPSKYVPVVNDSINASWSVDYASSDPTFVCWIIRWNNQQSGFTTNQGATWTLFSAVGPANNTTFGGCIAASTPTNMIWAPPATQPFFTTDGGNSWTLITLPGVSVYTSFLTKQRGEQRPIAADRVSANTFYLYYPGNGVFKSTNSGTTWTKVTAGNFIEANSSLSGINSRLAAVPGNAGHLFYTSGWGIGGQGLPPNIPFYRSTDAGATWQAVANVLGVQSFGFGKAAVGQTYPAIYIAAFVNSVYGIWRSVDNAVTWTQIGPYAGPNGLFAVTAITGDMNVYGTCYVGFGNQAGAASGAGASYAYFTP